MKKITLCIPYYNRVDLIAETLAYPLTDDRIDEIIICDDVSPEEDLKKLMEVVCDMPKVKVYKNAINYHILHNKRNAVTFAKNEWVYLLDSDNQITKETIDVIYRYNWDSNMIYQPVKAAPEFDYSEFSGALIFINSLKDFIDKPLFPVLLNTGNYFFNRETYLSAYKYDSKARAADVICQNYNHLINNRIIFVVPDLIYQHRVHSGSSFLAEADKNMDMSRFWMEKVKQLQ